MSELSFDIFSGRPDKNAVWLEAVAGLSKARNEIAAIAPGEYFIFSAQSHSVLVQIETFPKLKASVAKAC